MKKSCAVIFLAALAAPASAQHHSAEKVKQYLAGEGMGYAKAAELNHFPGPMHVLELAGELRLTAQQRSATERLQQEHHAEARALGAKLVAAEEGEYRLSHLETHRKH
jgi:L-amino acid N-acyltransferase YncA